MFRLIYRDPRVPWLRKRYSSTRAWLCQGHRLLQPRQSMSMPKRTWCRMIWNLRQPSHTSRSAMRRSWALRVRAGLFFEHLAAASRCQCPSSWGLLNLRKITWSPKFSFQWLVSIPWALSQTSSLKCLRPKDAMRASSSEGTSRSSIMMELWHRCWYPRMKRRYDCRPVISIINGCSWGSSLTGSRRITEAKRFTMWSPLRKTQFLWMTCSRQLMSTSKSGPKRSDCASCLKAGLCNFEWYRSVFWTASKTRIHHPSIT